MLHSHYVLAAALLFPLAITAQSSRAIDPATVSPAVLPIDDEPHHHLVLKNNIVKVFDVDLDPRDSMPMYRYDYDEIVILIGDATTVGTTVGRPDILSISKRGQVLFQRNGETSSVRNIGQTQYRAVSINLLAPQTGARNLCGKQIPNMKLDCHLDTGEKHGAMHEEPQFETDQMIVTLIDIQPRQQMIVGDASTDELVVMVDKATILSGTDAGADQTLGSGGTLWIARGSGKRVVQNNSDQEVRAVAVMLKR